MGPANQQHECRYPQQTCDLKVSPLETRQTADQPSSEPPPINRLDSRQLDLTEHVIHHRPRSPQASFTVAGQPVAGQTIAGQRTSKKAALSQRNATCREQHCHSGQPPRTCSYASIPGLTLNFAKCECVCDHFNVDFSSGWYAHGDRVKAASSAGSRQDRHLEHHLCFRIHHFEFG